MQTGDAQGGGAPGTQAGSLPPRLHVSHKFTCVSTEPVVVLLPLCALTSD